MSGLSTRKNHYSALAFRDLHKTCDRETTLLSDSPDGQAFVSYLPTGIQSLRLVLASGNSLGDRYHYCTAPALRTVKVAFPEICMVMCRECIHRHVP